MQDLVISQPNLLRRLSTVSYDVANNREHFKYGTVIKQDRMASSIQESSQSFKPGPDAIDDSFFSDNSDGEINENSKGDIVKINDL